MHSFLISLQDIVDARPSMFPITVNELFSIMDKASEGTFLLGELSSVDWSMFEKNEAIELIDVAVLPALFWKNNW